MQKRTFLSMLVAGAVSVPLSSHAAWAPSGEVSVIVAYKAGSGTDVGARLLASEAEKFVGRPLVVNNVPGADGKIGWTQLSRAKPDGRTIGFINLPTFTTLAVLPHSPLSTSKIVPICNHLKETGVVVVRADSKWKTLKDLVAPAGTPPEIINFYVNAFRRTLTDKANIAAHERAGLSIDFLDNKQLAALIKEQEEFSREVTKIF